MTADSVFRVASLTKQVMAVATLLLVDDGVLALDDPVDDLVPELADPVVLADPAGPVDDVVPAQRAITTRDLLGFTGGHGFPSEFDWPIVGLLAERLHQGPPAPQAPPPPDEWAAGLATVPLLHQPGEGWTYNCGADVLGVLVARAASTSLPDVLDERVFGPLGMVDTGFVTRDVDRTTTYYGHDDGRLVVQDPPDGDWARPPAFPSGGGGLVSTGRDWLAFCRLLLADGATPDGPLLAPDLVRALRTDHTTPVQREWGRAFLDGQGWGFGGSVDITEDQPWNVVGRYGWVGGTGTAAYVVPATDTATILLSQVEFDGPKAELIDTFLAAST